MEKSSNREFNGVGKQDQDVKSPENDPEILVRHQTENLVAKFYSESWDSDPETVFRDEYGHLEEPFDIYRPQPGQVDFNTFQSALAEAADRGVSSEQIRLFAVKRIFDFTKEDTVRRLEESPAGFRAQNPNFPERARQLLMRDGHSILEGLSLDGYIGLVKQVSTNRLLGETFEGSLFSGATHWFKNNKEGSSFDVIRSKYENCQFRDRLALIQLCEGVISHCRVDYDDLGKVLDEHKFLGLVNKLIEEEENGILSHKLEILRVNLRNNNEMHTFIDLRDSESSRSSLREEYVYQSVFHNKDIISPGNDILEYPIFVQSEGYDVRNYGNGLLVAFDNATPVLYSELSQEEIDLAKENQRELWNNFNLIEDEFGDSFSRVEQTKYFLKNFLDFTDQKIQSILEGYGIYSESNIKVASFGDYDGIEHSGQEEKANNLDHKLSRLLQYVRGLLPKRKKIKFKEYSEIDKDLSLDPFLNRTSVLDSDSVASMQRPELTYFIETKFGIDLAKFNLRDQLYLFKYLTQLKKEELNLFSERVAKIASSDETELIVKTLIIGAVDKDIISVLFEVLEKANSNQRKELLDICAKVAEQSFDLEDYINREVVEGSSQVSRDFIARNILKKIGLFLKDFDSVTTEEEFAFKLKSKGLETETNAAFCSVCKGFIKAEGTVALEKFRNLSYDARKGDDELVARKAQSLWGIYEKNWKDKTTPEYLQILKDKFFKERVGNPKCKFYILEHEGNPVSFFTYTEDYEEEGVTKYGPGKYFGAFNTDPAYRNSEVGFALFQLSLENEKDGDKPVYLVTNPDRQKNPALTRYEQLDFGVYDVVNSAGENEARMVFPWSQLYLKS